MILSILLTKANPYDSTLIQTECHHPLFSVTYKRSLCHTHTHPLCQTHTHSLCHTHTHSLYHTHTHSLLRMHAPVSQCVAVCCSMLQCVAVWCSVLQYVAVCCSVLQCVVVCYSVLQCVTVRCSVLQCVAVCCSVLHPLLRMPHLFSLARALPLAVSHTHTHTYTHTKQGYYSTLIRTEAVCHHLAAQGHCACDAVNSILAVLRGDREEEEATEEEDGNYT